MIEKTLTLSESISFRENIIILGEMHYNQEDKKHINSMIKKINPNFLLHELLYEVEAHSKNDIMKYLGNCTDRDSGPILCEPSLNSDIYEIGYRHNIPLIGIDIDDHEGKMKNLSISKKFYLREKRMVEKINKYYNKGKIVVVVGDTHLRTIKTKELGGISLIQKEFSNDNTVKIIRSKYGEIK
jgi:hypothetical protein